MISPLFVWQIATIKAYRLIADSPYRVEGSEGGNRVLIYY